MLVGERSPAEHSQSGKDDQRRVEQNESRLSDEAVLEENQTGAHSSSRGLAPGSLEGHEHDGNGSDTHEGREKAH